MSLFSVVDEQNRHTQVQRMSSSSSIKRDNSEELKDAEPRKCTFKFKCQQEYGGGGGSAVRVCLYCKSSDNCSLSERTTQKFKCSFMVFLSFFLHPGQGSLSPTSPIVLEKPESLNTVTFNEDSVYVFVPLSFTRTALA